jgi:ABC-type antimicrobial peptide transport system permease subunit
MALGATPRGLAWLVARTGLARVAVGVAGGLALSAAAAGAVGHLLFDVSARDPLTYVAVGALATAAFLVAGYLPTRRLSGIDPREVISAD